MKHITMNELQNNLSTIFDCVTHHHEVISVAQDSERAVVLLDANEYESLLETLYLSQHPVNAERLLQGIEQYGQGEVKEINVTAYLD